MLICEQCHDLVNLARKPRSCECGKCHGEYTDTHTVKVWGPCRVFAIDNTCLEWMLLKARVGYALATAAIYYCCDVIPEDVAPEDRRRRDREHREWVLRKTGEQEP